MICENRLSIPQRHPNPVALAADAHNMVCSEAEHEAMKVDGRFFELAPAIAGLRVTYDYGDGESETLEMRNCACGSTLVMLVASTPASQLSATP